MQKKYNIIIISFSVLLYFNFISSCSEDKSSFNAKAWCEDTCKKTVDCALGPTLEECMTECEKMAPNMLEAYLNAYKTCLLDASCTELNADEAMCIDGSKALCTTDTAEYNRTACLKILACDGIENPTETQISQCITRQHGDGDMIGCFKPSLVQRVIDCIENAQSCTPAPVATCVYDILGLELGTGNNHD